MAATRHDAIRARGDKLCGTRVIPLVIEEEKILEASAPPAMHRSSRCCLTAHEGGIVTTGNEVFYAASGYFYPCGGGKARPTALSTLF
jgi:hypothetical protein